MKILIIQLARYGDLVQTIPSANALKRLYPDSTVDFFVREKFSGILDGCGSIDNVIQLQTKKILKPFFDEDSDSNHDTFKGELEKSLNCIDNLIDEIKSKNYDKIVNLSFSPLSSYLTSALSSEEVEVCGYSRFLDGYLSIPDDASAYFYGQVGVQKMNRIHLCDIFANIVNVDLDPKDFTLNRVNSDNEDILSSKYNLGEDYCIFHIGASESHKSIEAFKWVQILRKLRDVFNFNIVLVGSSEEIHIGTEITDQFQSKKLLNLVGKTKITELFDVVNGAKFVCGADSLFMQLASLSNTPALNFSFQSIRFWETGPLSEKSAILYRESPEMLTSDSVVNELIHFGKNGKFSDKLIQRKDSGLTRYFVSENVSLNFHWSLIKALYIGQNQFPRLLLDEHNMSMEKLDELLSVMLEQITFMKNGNGDINTQQSVLEESENLLKMIFKITPDLAPIYWWYETEKIRIPPGEFSEILNNSEQIYLQFKAIVDLYRSSWEKDNQKPSSAGDI